MSACAFIWKNMYAHFGPVCISMCTCVGGECMQVELQQEEEEGDSGVGRGIHT